MSLTSKTGKWLFESYEAMEEEIKFAQEAAAVDADDGTYKCIRARSDVPMVSTADKNGSCRPCERNEAIHWSSFTDPFKAELELQLLLDKIEEKYPEVIAIFAFGGFDGAESEEAFAFEHEPWIANYEVRLWQRNE